MNGPELALLPPTLSSFLLPSQNHMAATCLVRWLAKQYSLSLVPFMFLLYYNVFKEWTPNVIFPDISPKQVQEGLGCM